MTFTLHELYVAIKKRLKLNHSDDRKPVFYFYLFVCITNDLKREKTLLYSAKQPGMVTIKNYCKD